KKDQENDHPEAPLETSTPSGLTSNQDEPDPQLSNRLRRPNCFDDGHWYIERHGPSLQAGRNRKG
ncbi:MAG: hypothetical protein QGF38_03390, partial [Rhodospirillales bacterium]|nr:hypothetical protein [Rhodospirillales bacterium]